MKSIIIKSLLILSVLMLTQVVLIGQTNSQRDSGTGSPLAAPIIPDAFESFTFTGTLSSTDPTRNNRLNRNTVVSSCAAPKTCDIFAGGAFAYDEFEFTNPDCANTVCIDVLLVGLCTTEGNIDVTAYDGSFDPNSICDNWIADPGFSSGTPPADLPMSFEILPGQTVVFVVSTPNTGGLCESNGGYELTVSGDFDMTTCDIEIVPTMGEWGLISLGMLLMIFGVVAVGQRKTIIA